MAVESEFKFFLLIQWFRFIESKLFQNIESEFDSKSLQEKF